MQFDLGKEYYSFWGGKLYTKCIYMGLIIDIEKYPSVLLAHIKNKKLNAINEPYMNEIGLGITKEEANITYGQLKTNWFRGFYKTRKEAEENNKKFLSKYGYKDELKNEASLDFYTDKSKTNAMKPYEKIKKIRREKKISQNEIAVAAGMVRSTYANFECGRNSDISVEVGKKIAQKLNVSFSELFEIDENNNNKIDLNEHENSPKQNVFQTIKKLRKEKKISQTELADYIGMKQGHISAIENGLVKNMTIETSKKIAEKLNIPFDELWFNNEPGIENQDNNEISSPTYSSILIKSIIKSKEIKCLVFTPNNEFYNTIGINQKRWGQIYRGEIEPTIIEAKNIANYFEFPVIKFFEH